MPVKICVPVVGSSLDEFLENLEKIQSQNDCVELRVDYIAGLELKDLPIIFEKTKKEAILTCRSKAQNGFFAGDENARLQILQKAMQLGFRYVDIEFETVLANSLPIKLQTKPVGKKGKKAKILEKQLPEPVLDLNDRSPETLIIISYHNFKLTPGYRHLRQLQKRIQSFRPHILKFATLARNEDDIRNLIRLLTSRKNGEKMIVLGMGEWGKITRIISPILGGYLTFASQNEHSTAAGQLNRESTQKAIDFLQSL